MTLTETDKTVGRAQCACVKSEMPVRHLYSQNPAGNRWYTQCNCKAGLTKESLTKVWVGCRETQRQYGIGRAGKDRDVNILVTRTLKESVM